MLMGEKPKIAWIVLCSGLSVFLALTILWDPKMGLMMAMASLAVSCGLLWLPRLPGFFLGGLGMLLLGYAFAGRSFAYLGIPPLYVGEIVLAIGVFSLLVCGGIQRVLKSPISWVLIIFALWGAIRTVPYLQIYGIEALRDGVIWGYGIFGLLVPAFLLKREYFFQVLPLYQKWIMLLLIWIPITLVLGKLSGFQYPVFTGLKTGDAAVHLAGIAVFLMLHLGKKEENRKSGLGTLRDWGLWIFWVVGVVLVITQSRGAFLAIALPLFLVFVLKPSWQWGRVIIVSAVLLLIFVVFDVSIDINDERKVSSAQIISNIESIFDSSSSQKTELEGTKEWRLLWWKDIFGYTVWGQYFWTGKGFGINLADADGYQVLDSSAPLRSPHNGHLTILARAGVPGLALWVILQCGFALLLIRAFFISKLKGQEWWGNLYLWILAYWSAFMINGAFDVFLEGPHGGIWFWCIFGFGIAALIIQQQEGNKMPTMRIRSS